MQKNKTPLVRGFVCIGFRFPRLATLDAGYIGLQMD
jgi:hypothetical protein